MIASAIKSGMIQISFSAKFITKPPFLSLCEMNFHDLKEIHSYIDSTER